MASLFTTYPNWINATADYGDRNMTGEIPPFKLNVSTFWLVFYIIVYGIIVIGSVVGNQLVIWSFIIEPKLRRSTNIFLVSLAIADFITGLIATPLAAFGRVVTGPYICYAATRPFLYVSAFMMCSVSIDHLVLITVDRYIAVTRPLRYPSIMTKGRCKVIAVIVWIIGGSFGTLPVLTPTPNPTLWVCGTTNYENATVDVHRLGTVASIPLILFILCMFYLRIFGVARTHIHEQSQRLQAQTKVDDGSIRKKVLKTTVTTAIVLGAFAACWLPTTVKFFVEVYVVTSNYELFLIQTAAEVLSFGNSMLNPIIYAFRNDLFRETYLRIINKVFCKKQAEIRKGGKESTATKTAMSSGRGSMSVINDSSVSMHVSG